MERERSLSMRVPSESLFLRPLRVRPPEVSFSLDSAPPQWRSVQSSSESLLTSSRSLAVGSPLGVLPEIGAQEMRERAHTSSGCPILRATTATDEFLHRLDGTVLKLCGSLDDEPSHFVVDVGYASFHSTRPLGSLRNSKSMTSSVERLPRLKGPRRTSDDMLLTKTSSLERKKSFEI